MNKLPHVLLFPTRSAFVTQIEASIRAGDLHDRVQVVFAKPTSEVGHVFVDIEPGHHSFCCNQPRIPTRAKAAAWALLRLGEAGRFVIDQGPRALQLKRYGE